MKAQPLALLAALIAGSALYCAQPAQAQISTNRTAVYLGGNVKMPAIPPNGRVYVDVNCSPQRSFYLVNPSSVPPPPPAPARQATRQPTGTNQPFPGRQPGFQPYQPYIGYQPYSIGQPLFQQVPVYRPVYVPVQQANASQTFTPQWTPTLSPLSTPSASTAPEKSETKPEPGDAVRLRKLEFSVSGVKDTAQGSLLSASLEKMKGVKGATVKRNAAGDAVVKVWFSEKEPVEADSIIQTVDGLGLKAVLSKS